MSGEAAPTRDQQGVAASEMIVSKGSPSAHSPARKGRKASLSDVNSWPQTGNGYDQLPASREQQARRLRALPPTTPSTPQKELWSPQRYDAVTKPSGGWLIRVFSAPFSRQEEEQPAPLARLHSAPPQTPFPKEAVRVMRQSQAEAWRVLGRRFHAAHGSHSSHIKSASPVRAPHRTSSAPLRPGGVVAATKGRPGPLFLCHHWCGGG
ncbi:hypothetical protein T484DRAFT_1745542 [Baffinella frigidus]|nr:hypothetical protein T484DRAFT_1745542 [Cryptophyta sp. CCMP2293]